MITKELVEHMNGLVSMSIGTSDLEMTPEFARIWGVYKGAADDELKIVVPKAVGQRSIENLRLNKNISLNLGNMADMITRQYKGMVTSIADASDDDLNIARESRDRSTSLISQFFGPTAGLSWGKFITDPSWTVTIQVQEIYDQTPGKMAGLRLI